jgi:hypothetical protein
MVAVKDGATPQQEMGQRLIKNVTPVTPDSEISQSGYGAS